MAKKIKTPPYEDVLFEKISSLHMLMEVYNGHNKEEFDSLKDGQKLMNEKMSELIARVGTQNGRVDKIEEREKEIKEMIEELTNETKESIADITKVVGDVLKVQSNCPGAKLQGEVNIYKDEMKPVYVIATNWKVMLFTILVLSLVLSKFPLFLQWIGSQISSMIEIGV